MSYSFLAKILGMTSSSNAHEREVAEQKLDEQLRKYGITKEELERKVNHSDSDNDSREAITWTWINREGKTKFFRVRPPEQIILGAVSRFFNGDLVICHDHFEVFATKGNKMQINLYTEYLLDALDRALIEERNQYSSSARFYRDFNSSFRKGWAYEVRSRLNDMKEQEERDGRRIKINKQFVNQSAMVVRGKNDTERQISKALKDRTYPRLSKSSGFSRGGSGRSSGQEAGSKVGLGRQVSGKSSLRLSGSCS